MLKKTIISIILFLLIPMVFVIDLFFSLEGTNSHIKKPVDMIIVLGGGLGSRIEKAWELQMEHFSKSDKILMTGIPLNPDKVVAQHPCLKYLTDHEEINYQFVSISETKNTWHEILYIKRYMQKHNYNSVIIVTDSLHVARVHMTLERVGYFKEAGLQYHIINDKKIDFMESFLNDKNFRYFALLEMIKRLGYEVRALGYNIASRIEKDNE